MDVLDKTLKIVENRTVANENLNTFKQELEECEDYISQLKENLQAVQATKSKNTEFLEINNVTKIAFNENSKEAKVLFGLIYGYVQQIEESLDKISTGENSLQELYKGNKERIAKLEERYKNFFKTLEIVKHDTTDRVSRQNKELEEQKDIVSTELQKSYDLWNNLMNEYEEKEKMLRSMELDLEIMQDDFEQEIQNMEKLDERNKKYQERMLENINKEKDLRDKIMEQVHSVIDLSNTLVKKNEEKAEFELKNQEAKRKSEELDKEIHALEAEVVNIQKTLDDLIANKKKEEESKNVSINEAKDKLLLEEQRSIEIQKEIEELKEKHLAIDEELKVFQCDTTDDDNDLEKLNEEHENLVKKSEELIRMIAQIESEMVQKQQERNTLTNVPNEELLGLEAQLKALEEDFDKDKGIEAEIEEIDLRNKNLQQTVRTYESELQKMTKEKAILELELEENTKEMKNLQLQHDNVEKEILRLEAEKKENVKLLPTPPQSSQANKTFSKPREPVKLLPTPPQSQASTKTVPKTLPSQNSQKTFTKPSIKSNAKKSPAKKRGFDTDTESDNSVDGERLSYAEFMARKKSLKEKKLKK